MSEGLFERFVMWLSSWFFVPPVLVDRRDEDIRHHAIVIGSAGYPLKIRLRSTRAPLWRLLRDRRMEDREYATYLSGMMEHLRRRYEDGTCRKGVLIVIHGGNEAPRKTVNLTCELYDRIEHDGYYPVFINWDASLWRSYVQQLTRIRSGVYSDWAWIWAPFYLEADILRGIVLLPPALWLYVRLLWQSRKGYRYGTTQNLEKFPTPHLKQEGTWPGGLTVSVARFIVTIPIQLVVLFLTGAGVPRAWENLLRRTRAMFRAPREFEWGARPTARHTRTVKERWRCSSGSSRARYSSAKA